MITKLLVLAASLASIWAFVKLLARLGAQNKELLARRQKEEIIRARKQAEKEADIIDLEQDPETGEFEERK